MAPKTIEISAPDHLIQSVTVFKWPKAEIVRTFEVDIKGGQTKIHITKLPSSLDTNYIRISTGSSDVQVLDVMGGISMIKEHKDTIRKLKVKKAGLESEKNLREHEADLLVSYARTLTGAHVQPDQLSTFLDSFVERGKKNLGAVTTLTEEILAIERSIQEQTDKAITKKGEARAQVSVVLTSEELQTVVLKLTYIVSNLHWKPTYELYTTSPISNLTHSPKLPSLTLSYRASLAQSTGEDWFGASLILSTSAPPPTPSLFSRTQGKASVPRLASLKLHPAAPQTFLPKSQKSPFGSERGQLLTGYFGSAPAPVAATTNTGALFGGVFTPANAGTATTGTGSDVNTTTTTAQQQQQSVPHNAFGSSNNLGSGGFSVFGGATGGNQSQDGNSRAWGGSGANTGSTANGQGSGFGASAFGSIQPAQTFSAFGSSQPAQACSIFCNKESSSQSKPQPQSQASGFGSSCSLQQLPSSSSVGRPATNNVIAPGFGAFSQRFGFGFGSAFDSSPSHLPSQNPSTETVPAFGRATSAPTPFVVAQSASLGSGPLVGSATQQNPDSGSGGVFRQPTRAASTFGVSTFGQQPSSSSGVRSAFGGSNSNSGQSSAFGVFSGVGPNEQGATSNTHEWNSGLGLFGCPPLATTSTGTTASISAPTSAPGGSSFEGGAGNTHLQQPSQQPQHSTVSGGLVGAATNASTSGFGSGTVLGNAGNTHQQQQQSSRAGGLFGASSQQDSSVFRDLPVISTSDPTSASVSASTTTTIKHETSPATSYAMQVQHGGDIPSDGIEHQVTIAKIPLETERLEWCQVKNASEYRLLAGSMNVIVDDNYAAKVSISDIGPGDTFTCTLGEDPDVHLSYSLTSHVVPSPTSQGPFSEAQSTTTFTSKVVLWNKHEWAIGNVVVKDIIPVSEENPQVPPYNYEQKVVLRKPEGLADVREGAEVEVEVEVLYSQDEKLKETKRVNVKGEEIEEYVQVGERDEEIEKSKGKQKEKEKEAKQVKIMWEKSVDGIGGQKEGRFEWRCEEIGAGEKVVLEAQWETKGAPYIRWVEVSA
ncbi:hypothetical protein L208DRAFT_1459442 [Tricholoma matsutake]|nr:hypothetical protein L208DRAFT_1459442 [Tricholoma matsutake 945]